MFAIASLLDPISELAIRDLWDRLETRCGLVGIKIAPLPHFSWQGADEYQIEKLEQILAETAGEMVPFVARTAGLGVFTGSQPVVYVPLVKDETLLRIHKILWERLEPYSVVPNGYYSPSRWVPHVTLAFHEVDAERLGCAVADIAFHKIEMKILVDHFAIIYQQDGISGVHNRFSFKTVSTFAESNS